MYSCQASEEGLNEAAEDEATSIEAKKHKVASRSSQ